MCVPYFQVFVRELCSPTSCFTSTLKLFSHVHSRFRRCRLLSFHMPFGKQEIRYKICLHSWYYLQCGTWSAHKYVMQSVHSKLNFYLQRRWASAVLNEKWKATCRPYGIWNSSSNWRTRLLGINIPENFMFWRITLSFQTRKHTRRLV